MKDYGELLKDDPEYADKAIRVADMAVDISEVISNEIAKSPPGPELQQNLKVAFHSPCTLQHGQKITGRIEALLQAWGFKLLPVADSHLCCGSAGTYSVLQPDLSGRLKADKLENYRLTHPKSLQLQMWAVNFTYARIQTCRFYTGLSYWIRLSD